MTTTLFDKTLPATDPDFEALLKHPIKYKNERAFVDSLWQRFRPHADSTFVSECRKAFVQRYWEMYLTCSLEDQGLSVSSSNAGPDVKISKGGKTYWIEAVAASAGNGNDKVPEMKHDGTPWQVPNEKIILRLTTAFDEKFRKYEKYVANKTVKFDEPYVIAINGRGVPFWQVPPNLPRIVSAVLPFGNQYVTINKKMMKVVDSGFAHRPHVTKLSGSPVPTTAFEDPRYAGISAVLYSTAFVWSLPLELGHLTYLIHNPLATNPLPKGFIKVATEYWVDGDQLKGVTSAKVNST